MLTKPISTHDFLNVRTYVSHNERARNLFLTEWLSNWLSVQLGPLLYGLPYHYAKINYATHARKSPLVRQNRNDQDRCANFSYEAQLMPEKIFTPCEKSSLDEFLLERYTAFTAHGLTRRFFRIWHPPWPQVPATVSILENSLLKKTWRWFNDARLVGANYSPGFEEVWMGRAPGKMITCRNLKQRRKGAKQKLLCVSASFREKIHASASARTSAMCWVRTVARWCT